MVALSKHYLNPPSRGSSDTPTEASARRAGLTARVKECTVHARWVTQGRKRRLAACVPAETASIINIFVHVQKTLKILVYSRTRWMGRAATKRANRGDGDHVVSEARTGTREHTTSRQGVIYLLRLVWRDWEAHHLEHSNCEARLTELLPIFKSHRVTIPLCCVIVNTFFQSYDQQNSKHYQAKQNQPLKLF